MTHRRRLLALALLPLLVGTSAFAGAPSATTTVVTRGIQGPPGPPALSTTLSGTFIVPTVASTASTTLTSASGAAVSSYVTVSGCGTFFITALSGTSVTLQNNGATGNASAGTFCNPPAAVVTSGPQGPGGAAGGNGTNGTNGADAFSSTSAGFTQPSAGNTVTVTVGHTSGFASGQVVYVTAGGYYTLTSITDATHCVLTNLGYAGNAGSGALVASGSTVTAGGLVGPAGSSGFTAGGDLSGTSTSQQVNGANPPSSSAATAPNFIVTPPASTNANGTPGSFVLKLAAPTGAGAVPQLQLFNGAVGLVDAQLGLKPTTPSTVALYMNNGTGGLGAPGASNYVTQVDLSGNAWFNAPYGTASSEFSVVNSVIFRLAGGGAFFNYPVTGDPSGLSPYGVHGEFATGLTAGGITLTAAQYAKQLIVVTPTGSGTIGGFPLASAGAGYSKDVEVTVGGYTVTLSDGTHTTPITAASGLYRAWFTSSGIYVR